MLVKNYSKYKKLIDGWEEMFRSIYCLVCTRCYGYYLPFTFLSPISDLFNHHHDNNTGLIIVNKELHTDPLRSKSYFKSNKYLNDVRIVYNSDSEADKKAKENVLSQGYSANDVYF
jgi:hypothetical protein